jgi:glucose/arabinose dehydrogenase/mono/diheme cytochrome c family protein
MRLSLPLVLASVLTLPLGGAEAPPANWVPPVLSPQEEARTFTLPPGYHLELVLSEPQIREPVWMHFDGNGRMYVVELRSYMLDQDGKGEFAPTSRVSRHESSHNDGHFDRHTVFADKLVLPREVLTLDRGQVVLGMTNTNDLTLYRDPRDTGVAASHELFYAGGAFTGNLEHQPSGLIWSIDNWIYSTYNPYRLRWQPQGPPLREPTAPNGGQWGLSQDDWGKLWLSNAGGEKALLNFQTHILYAGLDSKKQYDDGFPVVWPAIGLADFQGGSPRVREPDHTLNHFTASAGQEVYRGDRLPSELRGNLFIGEPVGRLVRRAVVEVKDGITTVRNPYQDDQSEFLRSTDPYFRPVDLCNGPDGCLYIVDMYRGIIQEGNWTRPGSYLRPMIERHHLEKVTGHGRIWRLVYDGMAPSAVPRLFEETPEQLVAELSHPNGWRRDTAQKLLVLRQAVGVAPRLRALATGASSAVGRLHALWTLEGLGQLDEPTVRAVLSDPDPRLRAAAIRVSESLFKTGHSGLQSMVRAAFHDPDPSVVLQAIMTAQLLQWPDWQKDAAEVVKASASAGVKEIGAGLMKPHNRYSTSHRAPEEVALLRHGQEIYDSLCFACHGRDGRGTPLGNGTNATMAPPLLNSRLALGPPEGIIAVVLHGLTGPSSDGLSYPAQMIAMGENADEWVAAAVSFVRSANGNVGTPVTVSQVAQVRALTLARAAPYTREDLARDVLPRAVGHPDRWKVTADFGPGPRAVAIDERGRISLRTPAIQAKGQWLQVQLPKTALVSGLSLDAGAALGDYPRKFKIESSLDGRKWTPLKTGGQASTVIAYATFPAIQARFLRFTLTEDSREGWPWSVAQVSVFAPR